MINTRINALLTIEPCLTWSQRDIVRHVSRISWILKRASRVAQYLRMERSISTAQWLPLLVGLVHLIGFAQHPRRQPTLSLSPSGKKIQVILRW